MILWGKYADLSISWLNKSTTKNELAIKNIVLEQRRDKSYDSADRCFAWIKERGRATFIYIPNHNDSYDTY